MHMLQKVSMPKIFCYGNTNKIPLNALSLQTF